MERFLGRRGFFLSGETKELGALIYYKKYYAYRAT